MNVGLINIASGGTLGHHTLHNKLKTIFKNHTVIILSEFDGQVPKQTHTSTVGGLLKHVASKTIYEKCIEQNIHKVIFSTFFDPDLVIQLNHQKIETILITYPLRDSYMLYHDLRKNYSIFDKVIILEDIIPLDTDITRASLYVKKNFIKNLFSKQILITCGGGGRPSGEQFLKIIEEKIIPVIKKRSEKFTYKIITGPYNSYVINDENQLKTVENMDSLYSESVCVISEAGYYTLQELLSYQLPGFIIPGQRRIDNQELRGVWFEKKNYGVCVFPEDNAVAELFEKFLDDLNKFTPQLELNTKTLQEVLFDD